MTSTEHSNCNHENLMVTGGCVRCADCLEFLPEHPDSDPRPGLVEANQFR